jgi:hypothetical protein
MLDGEQWLPTLIENISMDRKNLKPFFRSFPVWVLRILLILGIPIHLTIGMLCGLREGLDDWLSEWRMLK